MRTRRRAATVTIPLGFLLGMAAPALALIEVGAFEAADRFADV